MNIDKKIEVLSEIYKHQEETPYYAGGDIEDEFDTFEQFFEEYEQLDEDMNVVYRVALIGGNDECFEFSKDTGAFVLNIGFICPRKGRMFQVLIKNIVDDDIAKIDWYVNQKRQYSMRLLNFSLMCSDE